jgi:hypothetical protein
MHHLSFISLSLLRPNQRELKGASKPFSKVSCIYSITPLNLGIACLGRKNQKRRSLSLFLSFSWPQMSESAVFQFNGKLETKLICAKKQTFGAEKFAKWPNLLLAASHAKAVTVAAVASLSHQREREREREKERKKKRKREREREKKERQSDRCLIKNSKGER